MNKDSFWAGILMLTLPVFIIGFVYFVEALADSGINWLSVLVGFCIVVYVITAVLLIARGLSEKSPSDFQETKSRGKRK